jgi:hypothetical protein
MKRWGRNTIVLYSLSQFLQAKIHFVPPSLIPSRPLPLARENLFRQIKIVILLPLDRDGGHEYFVQSPSSVGRQIDRLRQTRIRDSLRELASASTTSYETLHYKIVAWRWWWQWVQRDPTYHPGILPQPTTTLSALPFIYGSEDKNFHCSHDIHLCCFTSHPSPPTLNFWPVCPEFYVYSSQYLHAPQGNNGSSQHKSATVSM